MLNHVTIRLFQLEQCGEHQLKKNITLFYILSQIPFCSQTQWDGHTKNQIFTVWSTQN